MEELKELMHNPTFDDRVWSRKNSNKRIIDVIYSGQTIEENPSKFCKPKLENSFYYVNKFSNVNQFK